MIEIVRKVEFERGQWLMVVTLVIVNAMNMIIL